MNIQNNHRCEQNTSLYIRREVQKKHDNPFDCRNPRPVKTSENCKCCMLPPVITNCSNPRENIICPKPTVCEKDKNNCNKLFVTAYGKELSSRKLVSE